LGVFRVGWWLHWLFFYWAGGSFHFKPWVHFHGQGNQFGFCFVSVVVFLQAIGPVGV